MKRRPDIIWSRRSKWNVGALVRSLRRNLKGRVDRAFLFGSHARRDATDESDIDLILIAETEKPWPERGRSFPDLREKFGSVDLLVYTPAEWRFLMKNPSSLIRHARRTWKQVV